MCRCPRFEKKKSLSLTMWCSYFPHCRPTERVVVISLMMLLVIFFKTNTFSFSNEKANELCAHDNLLESYYASSIVARENFTNTIFWTKHGVSTNVNYGYSQYFIALQVPKCEILRSKERNTPDDHDYKC